MTLKAIIWDMGGVLLRIGNEEPRLNLAKEYRIPLETIYQAVFNSPSAHQATLGRISVTSHWDKVAENLGVPPGKLNSFMEKFWSTDTIDYQLIDLIRLLQKFYKTALLSNAWDDLHTVIIDRWQIADAFDDIVISAEVGLAKPDQRIYNLAVARLGILPEEAVFIDDVWENVESAHNAGLQAIHYKTRKQVLQDLLDKLVHQTNIPETVIQKLEWLSRQNEFRKDDPAWLIHLQMDLEYQLETDRTYALLPNSSEHALYIVYQYADRFIQFYNRSIPIEIRLQLDKLSGKNAFIEPQKALRVLASLSADQCSGPYLSYIFDDLPKENEFQDAVRAGQRFEIHKDQKPVSWAWSIRQNDYCAEAAVETLPEYRQRGYGHQVTAAWAYHIIQQGRIAFFSHLDKNEASRALAHSLGLKEFARSISFE